MKKLLPILIGCFIAVRAIANPVFMPTIYLDRFFFDKNQNWVILMAVRSDPQIDSVVVSSSTGKSVSKNVNVEYSGLPEFVIRKDSLISNVYINPDGDSVTIITYMHNMEYLTRDSETFIFGNYRNSIFPKLPKGQFIKRILLQSYDKYYYSIGDSLGNTQGKLHGHIYDKNNILITNGSFSLSPIPKAFTCGGAWGGGYYGTDGIVINKDGTFSTVLYSLKYKVDTINILSSNNSCYYAKVGKIKIIPIEFSIFPDSSLDLDIHLLADFVSIKTVEEKTNQILLAFPNPLKNNLLHYEVRVPVKSTNCYIDLLNINGQRVEHFNITEKSGDLNIPRNLSNGSYLLQLRLNNKVYTSTSIIVNRQ